MNVVHTPAYAPVPARAPLHSIWRPKEAGQCPLSLSTLLGTRSLIEPGARLLSSKPSDPPVCPAPTMWRYRYVCDHAWLFIWCWDLNSSPPARLLLPTKPSLCHLRIIILRGRLSFLNTTLATSLKFSKVVATLVLTHR